MATPRKSTPKPAPVVAALASPEAIMAEAVESVVTAPAPAPEAPAFDAFFKDGAEKALAGAKDVQENFRRVAEEGLAQTRAAYEKMKTAAEEATGSIEASYATATRGFGEINLKALEVLKAQADASFEHLKALIASKSIAEAFTLQADHSRKQFEALTGQVKEIAELAQKVAVDTAEPLKTTFGKIAA